MPLPQPGPALGLSPDQDAFFFDVDGTLLEIAAAPDAVAAPPRIPQLLERLAGRSGGAVAIISGRTIDDLDHLFPDIRLPMAGEHGSVLRVDPSTPVQAPQPVPEALVALAAARRRLHGWAAGRDGVLVEEKSRAVALHVRRRPELMAEAGDLVLSLAETLAPHMFEQPGDHVFELRLAGPDKGDALRSLMDRPSFRGRRPIHFGDDRTDEAAFLAASSMGGAGVRVGHGGRPTAAAASLAAPAEVHACIESLLWP